MFFTKMCAQGKMSTQIREILPERAQLTYFDYNDECFGNIVAHIEYNGKLHVFVTDRGEICHNNRMVCDYSYLFNENMDTFSKLIEIIKRELT